LWDVELGSCSFSCLFSRGSRSRASAGKVWGHRLQQMCFDIDDL